MIDFDKLRAPFPPEVVSWRVGSTTQDKKRGMALAYIDARDVMERLDEVCGPENWQCKYSHTAGKTVCDIGINVLAGWAKHDPATNETEMLERWVWKADGAGDTDYEAEKGALSDSFKRAAVRWGIGRYLYDLDSPWVEVEQRGKSFVVPNSELPKLRALLTRAAPVSRPAPAQPAPKANAPSAPDAPGPISVGVTADGKPDWVGFCTTLKAAIEKAGDADEINAWMDANAAQLKNLMHFNKAWHKRAEEVADQQRAIHAQRTAA